MKRLFQLVAILCSFNLLINVGAVELKTIYLFNEGLALARTTEDEYVMINKRGEVVFSFTKLNISPGWPMGFFEGLMPIQSRSPANYGKIGFIDKTGKIVVQPQYTAAMPFSEGLAAVQIPHPIPGMNGLWGFIQPSGEFAIAPMYDNVRPFHEGRAFAYQNGGFVLIDKTGRRISDQAFETVNDGFFEGLAAVRVNQLWGFIDREGKWKISPRFGTAFSFSDGLAGVSLGTGGWGFINKYGEIIFDNVVDSIQFESSLYFYNGWAIIPITANGIGGYWYLRRDGNKLPGVYRSATYFSDGVAIVGIDFKCGVINEQGEWIILPGEFESISPFREGVATAIKNGKLGIINTKGEFLF